MSAVVLLCPYCGRLNDLPGPIDPDSTPEEGDTAICWRCGQPAVVEGNHLRLPTAEERAEMDEDPTFRAAMAAVQMYNRPSEAIAATRRAVQEGPPVTLDEVVRELASMPVHGSTWVYVRAGILYLPFDRRMLVLTGDEKSVAIDPDQLLERHIRTEIT